MADYGQPAAVTKRVRFFDGQYLQDQDFIDEQKYQLDRTRRLSRLLGFTGIAEGLAVSQAAGKAYTFTVTAGTAVDGLGRQLVLPTDVTLVLPADKFARQQNVAILLAFREAETDVAQTGGRSARRWDETPVVAAVTTGGAVAVAPADASTTLDRAAVPLATVSINDTGAIVVSPQAGRAAGLTVGGITATGSIGVGTAEPKARLHVAAGLGGSSVDLIVSGRLKSDSNDGGMWVADDRFVGGLGPASVGLYNSTAGWGLVMAKSGDVGVGTTAPSAKLEVAGKGGSTVDLVVAGRLKSNNDDGGLWVKDDRFVGGLKPASVGFYNSTAGWGLVMAKNGDVGVGTTAPENAEGWVRTLDLFGKANAKLSVRTDGIETRWMAHPGYWGAPAGMVLGTKSSHAVSIGTGAASRLTVTPNGNVGIGTAEPKARLHVAPGLGGSSIDVIVSGRLKSDSNDGGMWVADDRFVGGFQDKVGLYNASAGFGLVMVPGGHVGIGTTAPENAEDWARTLDLFGKANAKLSVRTDGIETRWMAHTGFWGAPAGMVIGTRTNHAVSIGTGAAARLTVQPNGFVGVGTTRPAGTLDVHGDVYKNGRPTLALVGIFQEHSDLTSKSPWLPGAGFGQTSDKYVEVQAQAYGPYTWGNSRIRFYYA